MTQSKLIAPIFPPLRDTNEPRASAVAQVVASNIAVTAALGYAIYTLMSWFQ